MINRIILIVVIPALLLSIFSLSCAKKDNESKAPEGALGIMTEEADREKPAEEPAAKRKKMADIDDGITRDAKKGAETGGEKEGLISHFLIPMDLAKERLLEYKVNITYECEDMLKSRQELLGITAKYGFIKSSNSTTETKNPYVTSDIFVKSYLLYDALKEFKRLGILLSENITVIDHTENMVLNERKVKREEIRIARKNRAFGQITARAKTWRDVEDSLKMSEDTLDSSEHEKWKIRDKVAWAEIHLYLKGPDKPDSIEVPSYRDAFVGMINLFLGLIYVLIWILPFIAVILLIVLKRKNIIGLFSRKRGDE